VRSISISNSYQRYTAATSIHGLQAEEHYRIAFQLLQQAMQSAAPTAALLALSGQQQHQQRQQQQQQSLRMTSYRSGCLSKPGAVDTLSALPAHSLTQLDLSLGTERGTVDAAAVSAALGRLSSLQQLRLSSAALALLSPGNCLASVPQLSRLTSLYLNSNWCGSAAMLQQLLSSRCR
jgi:hypothetical protein